MKEYKLLDFGFRLFFIGAVIFSIISVLLWMGVYLFSVDLKYQYFDSAIWHGHEMVFGYSSAVIVGFLFTAVRNWTGIRVIQGYPLLAVFLLWLLGRVFE